MINGKLISFEGIDGSGKGTQAKQTVAALQARGINAVLYSFPCYEDTFFGKEVGAFLRGEFGGINQVHPKLASMLYAMDRLEKKPEIIHQLNQGALLICDRYVDSNIAHQSSKLPAEERAAFTAWVEEMEYRVNGMPKPDLTFFLNVPVAVSKQMVIRKKARTYTDQKEDIHEGDYAYLNEVYHAYQQIEQGARWRAVDCCHNGELRSVEAINNEILAALTAAGITD